MMFRHATHELQPNQVNVLFTFYDDPENCELLRGLDVQSSSRLTKREAKYITMARDETLPAVDVINYRYQSQHLSIDKYVNNASSTLTPSHFTMEYVDQTNAHLFLIIHVYFNHRYEVTGEIKAKVVERNPDTS
jgi:hypothetical protein